MKDDVTETDSFFILLKTLLGKESKINGSCKHACDNCLFSEVPIACKGVSIIFKFLSNALK